MPLTTIDVQDDWDIGDRPIIVSTFTNRDEVLEDPTAIAFKVREPNGDITIQTMANATNISVGVWRWQLPKAFDAAGTWFVNVRATTGLNAAEEMMFKVNKSKF